MTGLACARRLAEGGLTPLIFDKGRKVGGRLATRVTKDQLQFDHGAQYITARAEEFRTLISQLMEHNAAALWSTGEQDQIVGEPSMSALAQALSKGLKIQQGTTVTRVEQSAKGFALHVDNEVLYFDKLVITVPAPQIPGLIGPTHSLSEAISGVHMAPCITLMLALPSDQPKPFVARRDPDDPVSWIARDSSKPGRDGRDTCWVAQMSPEWSAAHLELDNDRLVEVILPMLLDRIGSSLSKVIHVAAHRWRYALVNESLGKPFVRNEGGSLYLGGDWCLGARVEAAFISGNAIAADILHEN